MYNRVVIISDQEIMQQSFWLAYQRWFSHKVKNGMNHLVQMQQNIYTLRHFKKNSNSMLK